MSVKAAENVRTQCVFLPHDFASSIDQRQPTEYVTHTILQGVLAGIILILHVLPLLLVMATLCLCGRQGSGADWRTTTRHAGVPATAGGGPGQGRKEAVVHGAALLHASAADRQQTGGARNAPYRARRRCETSDHGRRRKR